MLLCEIEQSVSISLCSKSAANDVLSRIIAVATQLR